MKNKHVNLTRQFRAFDNDEDYNSEELRYLDYGGLETKGWGDLLACKRVVILAEPGTGKTEEFEIQALELKSDDKYAFFIRIMDLAGGDFENALLHPDDVKLFQEWLESSEEGWFFLDSVDEARNLGQNFDMALSTIAKAIEKASKRAHIYISSRVTDWRPDSDQGIVSSFLQVLKAEDHDAQKMSKNDTSAGDAFLALIRKSSNQPQLETSNPSEGGEDSLALDPEVEAIKIFHLLPLTIKRIEKFAGDWDVEDVEAFMEALHEASAIDYARRPQDLISKIARWKESGTLGSHYDEVKADISEKLKETNPGYTGKDTLSIDKAEDGVKTVAAALTLCKKPFILVEDSQEKAAEALDISGMLTDWSSAEQKILLRRAIFDPATYGTVNFHHRSVQELLTGEWLLNLIALGCPRRHIYDLLFPKQYEHNVIRTSLVPAAAWLGQLDEGFRRQIFEYSPEILIENGDPALLGLEARTELLDHFALHYSGRNHTGASFDFQNVKRLADPKLAPVIQKLWNAHPNDEDLCDLLLRLIWQGKISENCDIALSVLCRKESTPYQRIRSIFALHAAGSKDQKKAAAEALMHNAKVWGSRVVGEGIRHLFPEFILKDDLITLIHGIEETLSQDTFSGLPNKMSDLAYDVSDDVAETLLGIFLKFLQESPYEDLNRAKISTRYKWVLKPLETLCTRLLGAIKDLPSDNLAEATELVCLAASYLPLLNFDAEDIKKIVSENKALNRFFLFRAFENKRVTLKAEGKEFDPFKVYSGLAAPWNVSAGDFGWLGQEASSHDDPDFFQVCFILAFRIWNSTGRETSLEKQLKKTVSGNPALTDLFMELLNPPPNPTFEKWEEEDRQRKLERTKEDKQIEKSWLEFRKELQSNPNWLRDAKATKLHENFSDLWRIRNWLMRALENPNIFGLREWEVLIPLFGQDVAEAARDGMNLFWRSFEPPLYSEGAENISTNGSQLGLTGLAIEASFKSEWVKSLSENEARLAARYSVGEMNGFPYWLTTLAENHVEQVDQVFRSEIAWELNWKGEGNSPHHVVSRLAYEDDWLKRRFASLVMDQLEKIQPQTMIILNNAFRIILGADNLDNIRFVELARQSLKNCEEGSEQFFLWLAGWLCVDAQTALTLIEGNLQDLDPQGEDDFIQPLLATLFDHHSLQFGFVHADFLSFESLKWLLPWVYKSVRIADDHKRGGEVYTPDRRDNMESARGFLLERLYQTPGETTYRTLVAFSEREEFSDISERLLVLAERRAAADSDLIEFSPKEVRDFMVKYKKPIARTRDLFDVTLDRLMDVQDKLERWDEDLRAVLRQDETKYKNEPKVQKWYALELQKEARKQYVSFREVEVAGGNKTDIMVASEKAGGPVAIEVKVADSWTYLELMDALENQLAGKYLKERNSRYGILLMTRHRQKRWHEKEEGIWLSYPDLVQRLDALAEKIVKENSGVEGLEIVAIDLLETG